MKKLFPNYRKKYDMAVRVLGAMAEEIIKLREENDGLKQRIRELEGIIEEQGEELCDLRMGIREARAALTKKIKSRRRYQHRRQKGERVPSKPYGL